MYPFPLSLRDSRMIPSMGQFLLAFRSCNSARVLIASKSPSKLVPFRIKEKICQQASRGGWGDELM